MMILAAGRVVHIVPVLIMLVGIHQVIIMDGQKSQGAGILTLPLTIAADTATMLVHLTLMLPQLDLQDLFKLLGHHPLGFSPSTRIEEMSIIEIYGTATQTLSP